MQTTNKPSIFLIIFSALSFIPFIGIIFGLISIIIGCLTYRKNKLILILGCCGIGLTVLIYAGTYVAGEYIMNNPEMEKNNHDTTVRLLNGLSEQVEAYKCKAGSYPDKLQQLRNTNQVIIIEDMMYGRKKLMKSDPSGKNVDNFYYEKGNNSYKLFSVGNDGLPFTNDDIYPQTANNNK